jgi:hypothetical protein
MNEPTALLRALSDELGAVLPQSQYRRACQLINQIFTHSTEETTLPSLTLKLVRTLLPLYPSADPGDERSLVTALQPAVASLL